MKDIIFSTRLGERDSEEIKQFRQVLCTELQAPKYRNFLLKSNVPECDSDDLIQNVSVSICEDKLDLNIRDEVGVEAFLYYKLGIQKKRYWQSRNKQTSFIESTTMVDEDDEQVNAEIPDNEVGYTDIEEADSVDSNIKVVRRYRNAFGVDIINLIYVMCKLEEKDGNNHTEELKKVTNCLGYDMERFVRGVMSNRTVRDAFEELVKCSVTKDKIAADVIGKDMLDRYLA